MKARRVTREGWRVNAARVKGGREKVQRRKRGGSLRVGCNCKNIKAEKAQSESRNVEVRWREKRKVKAGSVNSGTGNRAKGKQNRKLQARGER